MSTARALVLVVVASALPAACAPKRRERMPVARGAAAAGSAATGGGSGHGWVGSNGTVEPVFQNGKQIGRAGIPQLAFVIDREYPQQQPADAPPYHVAGGTWTYFDAHVASDPAATFTVGVAAVGGGDEPASGRAMLVPTTAAAGARVVQAFAAAFAVPVPPLEDGVLAPMKVETAVLGHQVADQGNGYGGSGTWEATKWFLAPDDGPGEVEVFFNFSLAERRGVWSEKDADYDGDVASALAIALRDGQPAPRSPANDPTLAARPAQLVLGSRIPGQQVEVIASNAERAMLAIDHGDHNTLAVVDLHAGTVHELYSTPHLIEDGACEPELQRCVIQEVTATSRNERTRMDPSRLLLVDGTHIGSLAIPVGPYDHLWMSPDGRFLITGFGELVAWDLRTRRKLATLADPKARRDLVAWRDAALVLVQAADDSTRPIGYDVWHLDTGKLEPLDAPPPEASGTRSPDGTRLVDVSEGKAIVTPLPAGPARTLVLHPQDARAFDETCCQWLDSRYVVVPGKHYGFLDTDTMKVSLLPQAQLDAATRIAILDGSGRALVTTGAGTFLATVKP